MVNGTVLPPVYEPFILVMPTDPDPGEAVLMFDRQRAVVEGHTNRPQLTDFLELQRWMVRVRLQEGVALVGKAADIIR